MDFGYYLLYLILFFDTLSICIIMFYFIRVLDFNWFNWMINLKQIYVLFFFIEKNQYSEQTENLYRILIMKNTIRHVIKLY